MIGNKIIPFFVTHKRYKPKSYKFTHRFFWISFDLINLKKWSERFISVNKMNIYALLDRDHFPEEYFGKKSIKEKCEDFLREKIDFEKITELSLLTQPRFFGFVFNPISVYLGKFCDGRNFVVLEVSNTFGEVKYFWGSSEDENFDLTVVKYFYISPFSDHDNFLNIKLKLSKEDLMLLINEYNETEKVMNVYLKGKISNTSTLSIVSETMRVPFNTFKSIVLIHYHALVLFLKGIKYFKKNEKTQLQREVIKWKS